jgi:hypothetical protein
MRPRRGRLRLPERLVARLQRLHRMDHPPPQRRRLVQTARTPRPNRPRAAARARAPACAPRPPRPQAAHCPPAPCPARRSQSARRGGPPLVRPKPPAGPRPASPRPAIATRPASPRPAPQRPAIVSPPGRPRTGPPRTGPPLSSVSCHPAGLAPFSARPPSPPSSEMRPRRGRRTLRLPERLVARLQRLHRMDHPPPQRRRLVPADRAHACAPHPLPTSPVTPP